MRIIKYIIIALLICIQCYAGNQAISQTDASVIATRARAYLSDPTTWGGTQKNRWSDAQLLQWLNDGTVDIVSRTKCLESTETVTLLLNTEEYSLTGPYISIIRAVYNDSFHGTKKKLDWMTEEIGRTKEQQPSFWYELTGKIGIYPSLSIMPDANLAIGSTNTNVATGAFAYAVNDKIYTKSAVAAGTAPGNDVIPQSKYGAVAFDIGADATIDAIESYGNAAGYTTAALAASSLPIVAEGHTRLGYVTAMKSDGAFTFGTTALNAANTTVAYTDSTPTVTVYFVSRPAAVAASSDVLVPAQYDKALTYYIAAQAFYEDGKLATGDSFIKKYEAELERYRADLSGMPGKPQ